ncbi:MAG: HlyD family efflux transporter periplasmic adaptor subunit, partial [Oscillospiraceae bacterium]|nr:HlyD family efflux transporter periplasmic adaptor subunit [Oscillospiraceae bacterium]
RVLLYALIWDEVDEFTGLLRALLMALEALGHAEEACCPIEALVPRDASIIDVATLAGLDGEARGGALEVVTPEGKRAQLPRAVVTALTAELTIVMDQQPAPYFEHTDLLDFPGYRSRYKFDDVRRELKKPGLLKEMFLRGKVAYLFQRYCADRELTSMLLCIGPSNQEVQDLPGVINDWVCGTHGERPEDRADKQVSLFFVLTKFDMEFEQKKGAPEVKTRWDNRLHASLLDFFGKQHDWPREWGPGRPFNNMFLLRNPNFRFDAILEYDAEGREKGIRGEMQSYVADLETAFMKSALVAAHFREPRRSWDAAMRLNDGGISLIRESLSPLCNPEIKRAQLLQGIRDAQATVLRRLSVFHRSDDKEALRQQKAQLEVQLKELMVKKERLTLRAPEDGKILKVLAKEGEMISPSTPVVLLESNRSYYDIYVSEEQAVHIAEGDALTGQTVAGDKKVTGTVRLLTKAPGFADLKQSREKGQADLTAFQVRIYIDPQDGIIPGMTIGVKDSEFTKR